MDDPVKTRQEGRLPPPSARPRLEEWQNSLKTRFAAGAKVIVIMTPWHEDDLAGRILKSEIHVTLLRLPVEAEAGDPLGRNPGQALCPSWARTKSGSRTFAGRISTIPRAAPEPGRRSTSARPGWRGATSSSESGGSATIPGTCPPSAPSSSPWTRPFKGEENSDFVAITVWGKAGSDYYLLDCLNRHLDFPGTLQAIRAMARLYPEARAVLIEDKANGSAVIQTLQRELYCIPVNPRGGKVARVNAVAPAIEGRARVSAAKKPLGGGICGSVDGLPHRPPRRHGGQRLQALSYLQTANGTPASEEEPPPPPDLWDVYA